MEGLPTLKLRALELAEQAGEKIMRFYEDGAPVIWKKDASPLTAADKAAHEFLVECLRSLTPGIRVISEESEEPVDSPDFSNGWFWLVDPLDGTKEFVKRTNEFTVNIALIEDGQPVLGVVHAPALGLTYSGLRNSGAWRRSGNKAPTQIVARRLDSVRPAVVASKDHAGPLVKTMLSRIPNAEIRSMGSSLKFCLVAEGKADIYLRDLPTMEWDTAAAHCIVEAAGGNVYSLDGEPLRYGKANLKNPAIMTVGDTQFDWTALVS